MLVHNKVLLIFGFIRAYKGLIYLIRALPKILDRSPNIKLLIVGDFFEDKEQYYSEIKALSLEDYNDLYDGNIPDKGVGNFFATSDLVVLHYLSATQSGIV